MSITTETTVIGIFKDRVSAEQCFAKLINHGYPKSSINLVMSDAAKASYVSSANQDHTGTHAGNKMAQAAGVGGAVGTAIGATIAAIVATGVSVALPGLGLVIAGPLAAAAAGGSAGALTGGIIGGLVGMGMPEQNARAYNDAIINGGVIISVVATSSEKSKEIEQMMMQCGGHEVCSC